MSESFVQLNRTPNYADLIVNKGFQPSDEMAHIEDTALFWVTRHGRLIRRAWNEMTCREKQDQRDAERRAANVAMNLLCDWEGIA